MKVLYEEDRIMVCCEDIATKIGVEWSDIYFYVIWGTTTLYKHGLHFIDDTTLVSYLTKENHRECRDKFIKEVRQPFYEKLAERPIEQKLNYDVVFRNRKGFPHEEDKISTESIGRVFGSSAQQINILLSDAGLIYMDKDKAGNIHWKPNRRLLEAINAYNYEGTSPYVDYEVNYTHMYWTDRGAHWLYQNLVKKGWEPITWR